jgi:renalase
MTEWDVVVVGAGVTGLTIAHALQEHGRSVLLLDKGSRPGGRLASRPLAGHLLNPAAESALVDDAEARNEISRRTGAEFRAVAPAGPTPAGDRCEWMFDAPAGEIAKKWAEGTTRERCFVTHLNVARSGLIHVIPQGSGQPIIARDVVLTAPVPQSLHLLQNSNLPVNPALQAVAYDRQAVLLCVVNLAAVSDDVSALSTAGSDLIDSVRLRHSDGSGHAWLEVFATTSWSDETWNNDLNLSQMQLLAELHRLLPAVQVLDSELKRWRYANVLTTAPASSDLVPGLTRLHLAGDGFSRAREHAAGISRAVRSGLDLAALLSE